MKGNSKLAQRDHKRDTVGATRSGRSEIDILLSGPASKFPCFCLKHSSGSKRFQGWIEPNFTGFGTIFESRLQRFPSSERDMAAGCAHARLWRKAMTRINDLQRVTQRWTTHRFLQNIPGEHVQNCMSLLQDFPPPMEITVCIPFEIFRSSSFDKGLLH